MKSLHEWLIFQLNESQKIMRVVETIQAREDKLATLTEINQIKTFQKNDSCEAFSDKVIALVLESKSKKRLKKGMNYQPFLYRCDYKDGTSLKSTLVNYLEHSTPFHFDIIVKTGAHCSAVQLDFNGKDFWVYYIDAAGVPHNESFLFEISDLVRIDYIITQRLDIQHDQRNCAIFSIQHLNNLSYHSLKTEPLPAVFFKHSQKNSFFNHYLHKDQGIHKHHSITFQEHIDQYSIMVEGVTRDGSKVKTPWNYSILFKRHKYLQTAFEELCVLEKTMSQYEIQSILNARMRFDNINTAPEVALIKYSKKNSDLMLADSLTEHGPEDVLTNQIVSNRSICKIDPLMNWDEKKQGDVQAPLSPIEYPVNSGETLYIANKKATTHPLSASVGLFAGSSDDTSTMDTAVKPRGVDVEEASKQLHRKNKNPCSTLMFFTGVAVTFTGIILDTCLSNNLTQAIIYCGALILFTGYILNNKNSFKLLYEALDCHEDDKQPNQAPILGR